MSLKIVMRYDSDRECGGGARDEERGGSEEDIYLHGRTEGIREVRANGSGALEERAGTGAVLAISGTVTDDRSEKKGGSVQLTGRYLLWW